jgi:ABC-type multidrug transport system permease subunit
MFGKLQVLIRRELAAWANSPLWAFTFFFGPAIWVFIFGNALNSAFFSSPGSGSSLQGAPNYFNFIATAMVAAVPMAFSWRTGASMFADRFKGYLDRLLVSPVSRETIIFSKVLAGMVMGTGQAAALLLLTLPFGLELPNPSAASIAALVFTVLLLSLGFSAVSVTISMRIRNWPTQQLVGSVTTTPLMFLSNTFYPETRLPTVIRDLVALNPLSHAVAIVRDVFFGTGFSWGAVGFDFLFLVGFAALASTVLVVLSRRWL